MKWFITFSLAALAGCASLLPSGDAASRPLLLPDEDGGFRPSYGPVYTEVNRNLWFLRWESPDDLSRDIAAGLPQLVQRVKELGILSYAVNPPLFVRGILQLQAIFLSKALAGRVESDNGTYAMWTVARQVLTALFKAYEQLKIPLPTIASHGEFVDSKILKKIVEASNAFWEVVAERWPECFESRGGLLCCPSEKPVGCFGGFFQRRIRRRKMKKSLKLLKEASFLLNGVFFDTESMNEIAAGLSAGLWRQRPSGSLPWGPYLPRAVVP